MKREPLGPIADRVYMKLLREATVVDWPDIWAAATMDASGARLSGARQKSLTQMIVNRFQKHNPQLLAR